MAMDKMVEGRLRKYFEEVVLMEQKYVLNDSTNIKVNYNNNNNIAFFPKQVRVG